MVGILSTYECLVERVLVVARTGLLDNIQVATNNPVPEHLLQTRKLHTFDAHFPIIDEGTLVENRPSSEVGSLTDCTIRW